MIALADSLGIFLATDLTRDPDATRYTIQLEHASGKASGAYHAVKEAAAAYLEAQVQLVYAARQAHDAGLTVTELYTSWITTTPEEAVIEARAESDHEEQRSEQLNDAIVKIIDALRGNRYKPTLRIEDIEYHNGGPLPAWTPRTARAARDSEPQPSRVPGAGRTRASATPPRSSPRGGHVVYPTAVTPLWVTPPAPSAA